MILKYILFAKEETIAVYASCQFKDLGCLASYFRSSPSFPRIILPAHNYWKGSFSLSWAGGKRTLAFRETQWVLNVLVGRCIREYFMLHLQGVRALASQNYHRTSETWPRWFSCQRAALGTSFPLVSLLILRADFSHCGVDSANCATQVYWLSLSISCVEQCLFQVLVFAVTRLHINNLGIWWPSWRLHYFLCLCSKS